MRGRAGLFLVLAVCCSLPRATEAQTQDPTRVVSINPMLLITGSVQGEVEQRVSRRTSVAVSASAVRLSDRYTNADLKLRYYPNPEDRALHGVGFAIGVGVGRVTDSNVGVICASTVPGAGGGGCFDVSETFSGPTATAEVHHQWIATPPRRVVMSFGLGVKRYFVEEKLPLALKAFPQWTGTLRVSVGYAFR